VNLHFGPLLFLGEGKPGARSKPMSRRVTREVALALNPPMRAAAVEACLVHAMVTRMRLICANASFFSDGVISEASIPLRTIATISSR
jgi:hypothetical protein